MTTEARECGDAFVITAGEKLPAMSVSYIEPTSPYDSGYCVFFSDADPQSEDPHAIPGCLDCLIHDRDAQLGRGLDLAKVTARWTTTSIRASGSRLRIADWIDGY